MNSGIKKALERGEEFKKEFLESDQALTSSQACDKILLSIGRLIDMRISNRVLGVFTGPSGWIYPAFQFSDGSTINGLADVLHELRHLNPWSKMEFFIGESDALGGRTPVEAMEDGDVESVKRLARIFLEHSCV